MARITRVRRLLRKLHRATKRECKYTQAVQNTPWNSKARAEMQREELRAGQWKLAWWDAIESHSKELLNGSVSL